jgi:hypothetical protein
MPAIDKRKVSLQLPIKVIVKMDRASKTLNISRNEIASAILDKGTANVELTKSDLEAIHNEMEDNRAKRKSN